jgi:hypothetical protein
MMKEFMILTLSSTLALVIKSAERMETVVREMQRAAQYPNNPRWSVQPYIEQQVYSIVYEQTDTSMPTLCWTIMDSIDDVVLENTM